VIEFDEAVKPAQIDPADVWPMQYRALVRMLLFLTGHTHAMLAELSREAKRILADVADGQETLDGLATHRAVTGIGAAWEAAFKDWKKQFAALQTEAAAIAFGGLVALHESYVRPSVQQLNESFAVNFVFERQLKAVVDAANRRVYTDGLKLSDRLWRLDHQSRQGIEQVIYNGVANQKSAYQIAKDLEQYLGFGADCPRWTSTRLRLTKKEIAAGDVRGLKSGDACQGQGVAYNALRLARNELQIIHGLATDQIMAALPFVEQEQINLSPSHPVDDECDQVVRGGQESKGIYPKGTVELPLHVHCLCFKTAVLMQPSQFTDQLQGWMNNTQTWPAMDEYAALIGGDVSISLSKAAEFTSFMLWAVGAYEKMQAVVA